METLTLILQAILIFVCVVGPVYLLAFGLCRAASEADRRMQKMFFEHLDALSKKK